MATRKAIRVALGCIALLAVHVQSYGLEPDAKARVSGSVYLLRDTAAPMPLVAVWFHRSDGENFKAITNNVGAYEILLDPGYDYTVTAAGNQVCAIHRPVFRPKPGAVLKFDFTTTMCGNIEYRVVGEPRSDSKKNDNRLLFRQYYRSSYDPNVPYWFVEESIAVGESKDDLWLVVAFGQRDGDVQLKYGPFRVPKFSASRLPVTISFDTYTVQADGAVFDQTNRTLRVVGNVVVADGTMVRTIPRAKCHASSSIFVKSNLCPRPVRIDICQWRKISVLYRQVRLWLDPGMTNVAAASDLLKPCDARLMRCYPVSTRINSVVNDDEECSRPVELAEVQDRLFP